MRFCLPASDFKTLPDKVQAQVAAANALSPSRVIGPTRKHNVCYI